MNKHYEYVGVDKLREQMRRTRRRRKILAEALWWIILTAAILGLLWWAVLGLSGPYEAAAAVTPPMDGMEPEQGALVVLETVEDGAQTAESAEVEEEPAAGQQAAGGGLSEQGGSGVWVCLGDMKLTAYCNCAVCCGEWAGGPTASGAMPEAGRTVAVDPDVIPLGSRVYIDGLGEYVAEDTGSAIKGNRVDIYMDSHTAAQNFADGAGSCKAEVYIIK